MKRLLIATFCLTIISCQPPTKESKSFNVEHKGALKNFMIEADVSAKVDLSEFKNTPNFYALGAVEGLKGEIQIFNSQPYNTSVGKNRLIIDKTYSKKASLLVYASVEKWESISIPDSIKTQQQFEIFVKKVANEKGINTEKPFPFLLEGMAESFDWHVINWRDGDTIHTHKKHKTVGMHGSMKNREVNMVGFYSVKHQGIFTHHTSNMHMHVKLEGNGVGGHVDDVTLERGMILKLPKL